MEAPEEALDRAHQARAGSGVTQATGRLFKASEELWQQYGGPMVMHGKA